MLKNIPVVITPDLMKILMEMGHGDEIVISDRNFPAASSAQRLARCDGHGIPVILDAIMRFFPLDYAVEDPVILMALPAGNTNQPEVWKQYVSIINKYEKEVKEFGYLERFAFYERAKTAYAIIATGEKARFSNIILKKGIIREDEVTLP
jgi:L-fucose mutarotase